MSRQVLTLVGLFIMIPSTAFAQGAGASKASVDLVAGVEAVVPGKPFEMALRFRMVEGWHIYWQNPGDAGLPPQVNWTLPDGFTVGNLRFPVPKRHIAAGNIVSNIFEDEAVLLVAVSPPPSVSSNRVTITGDLSYLVCKETCLREKAAVRIELPVASAGAEINEANGSLFAAARKALPSRTSKYVTVKPSISETSLSAGKPFEISLAVEVQPGFHIQSHRPLQESFVKADVLMERSKGVTLEVPVFPPGQKRPVKVLGEISEYSGKIVIRVPGTVGEEPPPLPLRFTGLFLYQACNEQGTCFPPDALEFTFVAGSADVVPVEAAPEKVVQATVSDQATASKENLPAPAEMDSDSGPGSAALATDPEDPATKRTLLGWLLFAFVGGLLLNIMPCVLPVISIKVLSLVEEAGEEPAKIVKLGMTFVAGIVFSFVALAVIIIALKSAGKQLGWGFQFQSPLFIVVMASVIFLFGLSLFGVFTISLPGAASSKIAAVEGEHEGYLGAFVKGVLGTILATPCTAPYLGPALGWAFTASSGELLAVFSSVGFGMASPFVLLSARPRWLRFLPRPGVWMEHFKQFMGFLLMGTVVWLLYPLGTLIGPVGVTYTLGFLTFLGLAAWLFGKQTPLTLPGRRAVVCLATIGIVASGWWVAFGRPHSTLRDYAHAYQEVCMGNIRSPLPLGSEWEKIPWQPWSKGAGERLAALGYTVYVDYTADWCITCQANKKATLESELVRGKMSDLCVVPLKADFTRDNPDILDDLQRFGRSGVPCNVIYPAGKPDAPIVLPEQLVGRSSLVLEKLQTAGPSQQCGPVASVSPGDPGV